MYRQMEKLTTDFGKKPEEIDAPQQFATVYNKINHARIKHVINALVFHTDVLSTWKSFFFIRLTSLHFKRVSHSIHAVY